MVILMLVTGFPLSSVWVPFRFPCKSGFPLLICIIPPPPHNSHRNSPLSLNFWYREENYDYNRIVEEETEKEEEEELWWLYKNISLTLWSMPRL